MIKVTRTNSSDRDFVTLVNMLNADLARRDGDEHSFYSQFNKIDQIRYVIVAYDDDVPAGCGAIKAFGPGAMEIKRMFVYPKARKKGVATRILNELELWAKELSCDRCVLETGRRQPEAIELYRKNGYRQIPNYGQYVGIENSLCFEKSLTT
ncbi:MAG: GNAT family N-acetyltransferase [Bacteroidota bacterium]|nr:GNAT family N-acetyltransferase [Bacteroidota bacterium]